MSTPTQSMPTSPLTAQPVFQVDATGVPVSGTNPIPISGSISATNPSVGTDGAAIPTSSTLIGASDGTNLQQLLVESASNRNLRTGIYSGANEATVTGSNALKVDGSAVTQPVSGTVNTLHGTAIDATNSSTATLTANSVFTGTSQSALNYSALSIEVFADQASAANGLSIQQSQDGTNWDTKDAFSVTASTNFQTTVNLTGQFYRIVYTNGGTNQGTFRLQTVKQTSEVVLPRALTSLGNLKVAIQEDNTTGLATAANQSTANTSLSTVAGAVTSSKMQSNVAQIGGQAPTLDNTSILAVSMRGKNSTAGDTSLGLDASGRVTSIIQAVGGTAIAVGNNSLPILNSAATGYVSAYGSNLAATVATTDYSFKWGAGGTTQVNHVMLQNNTTANIQYDLDTAANAGSPILAPGQTIFFDVQTTTLHLYTAAIQNVNGSTAGNIVVRGWL